MPIPLHIPRYLCLWIHIRGAFLYRMAMVNTHDNLPKNPADLRQFTELLAAEIKSQALMIEKLQHQLHGANGHHFGAKSMGMDQLQLFAQNEESSETTVKVAKPEAENADQLPLYRQGQSYAREGVNLDRSTMADWSEVACMAHIRRKFVDVFTVQGSAPGEQVHVE